MEIVDRITKTGLWSVPGWKQAVRSLVEAEIAEQEAASVGTATGPATGTDVAGPPAAGPAGPPDGVGGGSYQPPYQPAGQPEPTQYGPPADQPIVPPPAQMPDMQPVPWGVDDYGFGNQDYGYGGYGYKEPQFSAFGEPQFGPNFGPGQQGNESLFNIARALNEVFANRGLLGQNTQPLQYGGQGNLVRVM